MTEMTRRDRDDLQKVTRMRAKLAKDGIAAREAELLADVEQQLAAEYRFDEEVLADITRRAQEAIQAADADLAQRCRDLGVREEFRPRLEVGWYARGRNASKSRRAELRAVAQTQIAAAAKHAKTVIDSRAAEVITELIVGGLQTDEAKAYVDTSIPTAAQLMPTLTVTALEQTDRSIRAIRQATRDDQEAQMVNDYWARREQQGT